MKRYNIYADDCRISVEVNGEELEIISTDKGSGWPFLEVEVREAR